MENQETKEKSTLFVEMYDQYVDLIYRFSFFKVSNKELAWDITQECFLKAWRQMQDETKEIKNQRALLFTVARNLIIDHWRQKEKQSTVDMEDVAFTLEDGQNLHNQIIAKEEIEQVMQKLNQLPAHQREIIIMRYTDDLSFSDISKITGRSAISVRVESHRAVKKLKQLMNGI